MAIVLDADVVIRGEKGKFALATWLASKADETFEIAAVTVAELWHGIERATGSHRAARERYLTDFLAAIPIIPYTEQTAFEHARIWARLTSRGNMIGYYDLIVAATALERGSQLATFNTRHFSRIKGLNVIKPE